MGATTATPNWASVNYVPASDPFLLKRARTWWAILALFLLADNNGFLTTLGARSFDSMSSALPPAALSFLTGVMWITFAGLMVGQFTSTFWHLAQQKVLLSFALLAFLSILWSQAPRVTLSKAIVLLLYLLTAQFFATYYTPQDQMRLLLTLGVIMALASIACVILLPKYGIQSTGSWKGEWKGVFGGKNFLGSSMFYLFSGLPFCRISNRRQLLRVALQGLLPLGLMLMSRSRTPLFMTAALLAVRYFGPLVTRTRREALPFLLYCGSIAIAIIPFSLAVVLPLMGRDLTFSGRTHAWLSALPLALKHFWLGYGYQAFWIGASGEPAPVYLAGILMRSVDNGYLDIMLQFGIVGVGLLLALLIVSMRDFVKLLQRPSVPLTAYWYAGLILATFIGAIAENMFWYPVRIIPFMLALACAGLRNLQADAPASVSM